MTTNRSFTDVPSSLSHNENLVNSPIVKQPQAVKSTASLSSSTSSANTNVNNSSNETSEKASPSKGTQSVSYLDDSNLKLAIIDYSDILKLIKLQNSIEYQEWLAFNSKTSLLRLNTQYSE